jgi:hypothetical protein
MVRLSVAIRLAAAVSAVAIPGARGSSVTVEGYPRVFTYSAEQGEVNHLNVRSTAMWTLEFTDSVALKAGERCVSQAWNRVTCTDGGNANINLGDNNDTASVVTTFGFASIFAGDGQDSVNGEAFGGGTNLYGEDGNDSVTLTSEGGGSADGGNGNDMVVIHATCPAGGGTAFGGPGDDNVRYTACGNWNSSGAVLDGGSGADLIVSDPVSHFGGRAYGGDGNDIVRIRSGQYEHGPFVITGGSGDDALSAGGGADTVAGDDGNDYIDVQGGRADAVTCGAGSDIVLYDASDTVSDDCEIRIKDSHLAWSAPGPSGVRFDSGLAWAKAFPTGVTSRTFSGRDQPQALSRP